MSVDPADYAAYVAALPVRFEASLMSGDSVSTAFYECRKAGWSRDALVGDALHALTTTRNGGVGLVVHRLRGLATQRPQVERAALRRGAAYSAPPRTYLPPSHAEERSALLGRIWEESRQTPGSWPAERSEQAMAQLVAAQKAES